MTKKEMENKLRGLIEVLMTGSQSEYRQAKKEIDSLWNRDSAVFKRAAPVIFEYLPRFEKIETNENKKAFISGIDLFYLALGEKHFEALKDFTLKTIQEPHGHVREAARHTAEWLYGSLIDMAVPFRYSKCPLSADQQAGVNASCEKYIKYVEELRALAFKYRHQDDDAKYIYEAKPSVYKSVQQLLSRAVESTFYAEIVRSRPVTLEIFMKRKEIERGLAAMLKRSKCEYSVSDVLDIIFNEQEEDDMRRLIAIFDNGGGFGELSDAIELITDAWNYFPHEVLGGKSPAEIASLRSQ